MREWLDRDILNPCTYGGIAYLLLALPLGIAEFTFLVTAISLGAGLAVTLIGIPVLIFTVYAWRWIAQLERRLIAALTGRVIADPVPAAARRGVLLAPAGGAPGRPGHLEGPCVPSAAAPARRGGLRRNRERSLGGCGGAPRPGHLLGDPRRHRPGRGGGRHPPRGVGAGRAGRRGAAPGNSLPRRARPRIWGLRGAAPGLERRPGAHPRGLRSSRRPLAHHRGCRRRAPAHRARPARRRATAPRGPGAQPAHG